MAGTGSSLGATGWVSMSPGTDRKAIPVFPAASGAAMNLALEAEKSK